MMILIAIAAIVLMYGVQSQQDLHMHPMCEMSALEATSRSSLVNSSQLQQLCNERVAAINHPDLANFVPIMHDPPSRVTRPLQFVPIMRDPPSQFTEGMHKQTTSRSSDVETTLAWLDTIAVLRHALRVLDHNSMSFTLNKNMMYLLQGVKADFKEILTRVTRKYTYHLFNNVCNVDDHRRDDITIVEKFQIPTSFLTTADLVGLCRDQNMQPFDYFQSRLTHHISKDTIVHVEGFVDAARYELSKIVERWDIPMHGRNHVENRLATVQRDWRKLVDERNRRPRSLWG
jgi:hypothetical protein